MNPFDIILVATDFSASANNAVRRAALLAREHDARLRILHVIDHGGVRRASRFFAPPVDVTLHSQQARIELHRLAEELSTSFQVTAELVLKIGDPLDVLVRESDAAGLVVLGRRAGGSIKDWGIGTPAGRLLDDCLRPVLVVKQSVEGRYRSVLTGLDFTPASDAAALLAAALAPTADLRFTHVFHSQANAALIQTDVPSSVLRDLRESEEVGVVARMRRRVAAIGLDSRKLHFAVARASSSPAMLDSEQTKGADLVAVGRQRRTRWLDALLGSVSRRVLARAQNDVLVVPHRPEHPAASPARASWQLAGSRAHGAAPARRCWTIEADPANTRAPAWQAGAGLWRAMPVELDSR